MFLFEKLAVYQKALNFAECISNLTSDFPRGSWYLADQLNRASLSISLNIAEGNGRWTVADRKNFFGIARGSVHECVPLMELCRRKKLLNDPICIELKVNVTYWSKKNEMGGRKQAPGSELSAERRTERRLEMRRVAMVVGVLLLVSVCALAGEPGNIKDLVAGKVAPFTMKLKELDGSYLRFSSPYLSGGGWLSTMRSYGGGEGTPAYSQGRTVKIGDENFLIAYSVETQGGDPSFMYGRPDPNAPEPEPVTEDSILTLALICQRSAIALTKVRPFNLAAELADYQRYLERYKAMVATRSSMNQPTSTQAPDNLKKVAIALDMFGADHEGALPAMDKPEAFRKALDDYVENVEVFKDSETKDFFGVNPTLSGKKVKEVKNPAETIAVYQVKPGKDGKRGVIFADGSIKRLTAAEWTDLKVKSKIP